MSSIIQLDTLGKERTRLVRAIVLALRQLAAQTDPGPESLDLAAFMALALQRISDGIDPSVAAWEKRGYWVKADRFRMEWAWTGETAAQIRTATLKGDWAALALSAARVGQKLAKVQLPARHKMGKPWVGALERLRSGASVGET